MGEEGGGGGVPIYRMGTSQIYKILLGWLYFYSFRKQLINGIL